MTRQRVQEIEDALKPHGYEWLLGMIGIAGPGNLVVVFAGPGDFYTALLTHNNKVLWCKSCGDTGEDSQNG